MKSGFQLMRESPRMKLPASHFVGPPSTAGPSDIRRIVRRTEHSPLLFSQGMTARTLRAVRAFKARIRDICRRHAMRDIGAVVPKRCATTTAPQRYGEVDPEGLARCKPIGKVMLSG